MDSAVSGSCSFTGGSQGDFIGMHQERICEDFSTKFVEGLNDVVSNELNGSRLIVLYSFEDYVCFFNKFSYD